MLVLLLWNEAKGVGSAQHSSPVESTDDNTREVDCKGLRFRSFRICWRGRG